MNTCIKLFFVRNTCTVLLRGCPSAVRLSTFSLDLKLLCPSKDISQASRLHSNTATRDKLLKKIKDKLPKIENEDIEETFIKGSGPGGQSVNKTTNCVVLRHKPSGIIVKCHQTRSLEENRKIGRYLLQLKLDEHLHGKESAMNLLKEKQNKKEHEKKRRTRLKLERLKAMKENIKGMKEADASPDE